VEKPSSKSMKTSGADSALTLYWCESSSGSRAVMTMPVNRGSEAGAITDAWSCLSG
jgi:hypothetical protein